MAATPIQAFRLNARDVERIEQLRRDLEARIEQPVTKSAAVRHALRIASATAEAMVDAPRAPLGERPRAEYGLLSE